MFSLPRYTLLVFGLSWPFQLPYLLWGEDYRRLLLLSMVAVGAGTLVAGRYWFRDGFAGAGWSWGKLVHYLAAVGLALLLWWTPSLLERWMHWYQPGVDVAPLTVVLTLLSGFAVTLVPAFGEEFSWRGYLLPRLLEQHSPTRALLTHGFVTWAWHLPVIVAMGFHESANPVIGVALVLAVSLIPTVLHAVVMAYMWKVSGSLAVATVYHAAFDEVRDALVATVGLGVLGANWQTVFITLLGIWVLRRGWSARSKSKSYSVPVPIPS